MNKYVMIFAVFSVMLSFASELSEKEKESRKVEFLRDNRSTNRAVALASAQRLFSTHQRGSTTNLTFVAFPRGSWIVSWHLTGLSDQRACHTIISASGDIDSLTDERLFTLLKAEYVGKLDLKSRLYLASIYIAITDGGNIVREVEQIPDYQRSKMKQQDEIRLVDESKHPNPDRMIFYTYTNLGGQVWRYEFTFSDDGSLKDASRTLVAENIGKALVEE